MSRIRSVAFSDPFIRALRTGLKVSFRRPVELQAPGPITEVDYVLWVKESWRLGPMNQERVLGTPSTGASPLIFRADVERRALADYDRVYRYRKGMTWSSAMTLPLCHSRFHLHVTAYRAEQLDAITDEQARGEGMPVTGHEAVTLGFADSANDWPSSSRAAFASVWDRSMKDRGYGWDANPLVHVVEFAVTKKP